LTDYLFSISNIDQHSTFQNHSARSTIGPAVSTTQSQSEESQGQPTSAVLPQEEWVSCHVNLRSVQAQLLHLLWQATLFLQSSPFYNAEEETILPCFESMTFFDVSVVVYI